MITDEERAWITEQIQKTPCITLTMLDNVIKEYLNDLAEEDAKYMKDLADLDFQKRVVDTRLCTSPRYRDNMQNIRTNTRKIAEEHQLNLLHIDEELNRMYKIKKVFIEMYPKTISPPISPLVTPIASPRLAKLVKSNSFLKRSVEFLLPNLGASESNPKGEFKLENK